MRHVFWLLCSAGLLDGRAVGTSATESSITRSHDRDTDSRHQSFFIRRRPPAGGALFQTHCSYCHGSSGEGGRGADLTSGIYLRGGRDPELYSSIRWNSRQRNGTGARNDEEVWKMVAFVKRIGSQGLLEKGDRRSRGRTCRLSEERMWKLPSNRQRRRRARPGFDRYRTAARPHISCRVAREPRGGHSDQLSRRAGDPEIRTIRFGDPAESR